MATRTSNRLFWFRWALFLFVLHFVSARVSPSVAALPGNLIDQFMRSDRPETDIDSPDRNDIDDGTRDPFAALEILTPGAESDGVIDRILNPDSIRVRFTDVVGAETYSVAITDENGDRVLGVRARFGMPSTALDYRGSGLETETEYRIRIHVHSGDRRGEIDPEFASFIIPSLEEREAVTQELQRLQSSNLSEVAKLEQQVRFLQESEYISEAIARLCDARVEGATAQVARERLIGIFDRFSDSSDSTGKAVESAIDLACADAEESFPSADE